MSPFLLALASGVPVEPDRDQARQWLLDELGDPVYDAAQPSLFQRVVTWVMDRLNDLEVPTGPGGTALLVVVLVILVVLVALAFTVAGPLRRRARSAGAGDVFADATATAAEHRARAEQAAGAGRWQEAVTERFRAVVRSLEERVVLDVRPGRTAHEAAAEAAPSMPGAAAELLSGATVFDDVVYGDRPGTQRAYEQLRDLDQLLERTRPQVLR